MAELRIRTARHTMKVAAPPKRVYQLIAQMDRWPQIFEPTVAVRHLGLDGTCERVHQWVIIDDEVRNWVSRRELDPHRLQVRFRQEVSPHPLASMGGLWLVLPKGDGSLVALDHHYRVVDDNPVDAQRLAESVDRDSFAVLSALRDAAEVDGGTFDGLLLSFEDSMDIAGNPTDVYDFLARAEDWPSRLPHVTRLLVDEYVPDIQQLELETRIPDVPVEATGSVRVCFPETHIVYKRTRMSGVFRAHTGTWLLTPLPHGVRAIAQHNVLLRPEAIAEAFGPEATLDDARATVRRAVSNFSLTTLGRAKMFAEARFPTERAA